MDHQHSVDHLPGFIGTSIGGDDATARHHLEGLAMSTGIIILTVMLLLAWCETLGFSGN